MNQIQFQLGPPHKAKIYYKIGTNIIIIQSWWAGFCLMKPVNLYHPTTIFTSQTCFAPAFWSHAIWQKAATEIENSSVLSGVCSWRLLIHLDRIHSLFQRGLCATCMLRIWKINEVMSHLTAIDSGNWFAVVQQKPRLWHIIASDLQLSPHTHTNTMSKHTKKGVCLRLQAYTSVFDDLKGGLLQTFSDKEIRMCEHCFHRLGIFSR